MRVLSVLAFLFVLVCSGVASAAAKWHPVEGQPGWVGLWVDDVYVGRLEPFQGTWEGRGRPAVSIREFAERTNPPTGKVLDKPSATAPTIPPARPGRPLLKGDDACPCGGGCNCDPCRCSDGKRAPRDAGPTVPPDGVLFEGRGVVGGERFTLCGKEVSRAEALAAVQQGVPADAGLPRLVVIGTEASARKKVVADLSTSPDLAFWRDKLSVTEWLPDSWRVRDGGFRAPAGDGVTVYVMDATGKVLWRQDDYEGGAPKLSRALRDKVPGYDPARDPTPKVEPILPASPSGGSPSPLWLLVLVAPAAYFLRRLA